MSDDHVDYFAIDSQLDAPLIQEAIGSSNDERSMSADVQQSESCSIVGGTATASVSNCDKNNNIAAASSVLDKMLIPSAGKSDEPIDEQFVINRNRNVNYFRQFADGKYGKRLYGGVMSDEKFAEVRMITMDCIEKLHKALQTIPTETDLSEDPKGLTVDLLRHQKWGLTWMCWREAQAPPGGVLADDMGLGKTLSVISLILKQQEYLAKNPLPNDLANDKKRAMKRFNVRECHGTLVIAPMSVLYQWKAEIKNRCDKRHQLSVLIYHGPERKTTNAHRMAKFDVVLTTYDTVGHEIGSKKGEEEGGEGEADEEEETGSPLMALAWDRIVLDEAHIIRNYNSVRAKAIYRLRAVNRWCLSGTPIHNKLEDLYSLVKFLRCTPFDEISVWRQWIMNGQRSKERLDTMVKGLVLRREKSQECSVTKLPLVVLPDKEFVLHKLDLKSGEKELYDQLFTASKLQATKYLMDMTEREAQLQMVSSGQATEAQMEFKDPFIRKRKAGSQGVAKQDDAFSRMREILVMLLRLRQAAVHPVLIKEAVDLEAIQLDAPNNKELAEEIHLKAQDEFEAIKDALNCEVNVDDLFDRSWESTKIEGLLKELKTVLESSDDKCVIVSQWTSLLDIVESHLISSGVYQIVTISGKIPAFERQEIVSRFNRRGDGARILLLSLTAGGVGLNLIGGNHLFMMDLHWNPALEQQACDRIYRVGQEKPTFIHKFMCRKTIEQGVSDVQEYKLQLASSVLSGLERI